jgi:hypothetical protein
MRLMERRDLEREKLTRAAGVVVSVLRHVTAKADDEIRAEARQAFREALVRPSLRVETLQFRGGPEEATDMPGVYRLVLDALGIDRADQVRQETLVGIVDGAVGYYLSPAGKAAADGQGGGQG